MKNKRKENDVDKLFGLISNTMIMGGGLFDILNEVMKDPRDVDKYHLGNGLYLLLDKTLEDNRSRYCKLVREDNSLVSDYYFRLGGMSSGFEKKSYCMLIIYRNFPDETWGNHCIIDKEGKIVLEAEKYDSNFYYYKGVIASKKGVLYNLLNGQPIVNSTKMFESTEFYFVEHSYDYENKYPLGVYKIHKNTGEFEIFN